MDPGSIAREWKVAESLSKDASLSEEKTPLPRPGKTLLPRLERHRSDAAAAERGATVWEAPQLGEALWLRRRGSCRSLATGKAPQVGQVLWPGRRGSCRSLAAEKAPQLGEALWLGPAGASRLGKRHSWARRCGWGGAAAAGGWCAAASSERHG